MMWRRTLGTGMPLHGMRVPGVHRVGCCGSCDGCAPDVMAQVGASLASARHTGWSSTRSDAPVQRPRGWSTVQRLGALRPSLRITPDEAQPLLEGFVRVNEQQIRNDPEPVNMIGALASGRLFYDPQDPGEEWQTYNDLASSLRMHGYARADCEDLASAIAAEMRVTGYDPGAWVRVYKTAPNLSHVVIASPRLGRLLDPSIAGGMEA